MSTFTFFAWIAFGFALLLFLGLIIWLKMHALEEKLLRRKHDEPPYTDTGDDLPFIKIHVADGLPCQARGEIWTDQARDEYRQRQRNLRLRVVQ